MSFFQLVSGLAQPLQWALTLGGLIIAVMICALIVAGVRKGAISGVSAWPPRVVFRSVSATPTPETIKPIDTVGAVVSPLDRPITPQIIAPSYPRPQPPQRIDVPPDGFAGIIFQTGAERGAMYVLGQRHNSITIGRSPDCDIVISDESASRCHFRIAVAASDLSNRKTIPVVRLIDAGSANGTHVNGERAHTVELADGDLIEVGDTRMRFKILRK